MIVFFLVEALIFLFFYVPSFAGWAAIVFKVLEFEQGYISYTFIWAMSMGSALCGLNYAEIKIEERVRKIDARNETTR